MRDCSLEVSFHSGRPYAAYYHLPRDPGERSARSRRVEPGMVVDFNAAGVAIGIEITDPASITTDVFNRLLGELGQSPVDEATLAPLHAA
jgi:hypothetical protein